MTPPQKKKYAAFISYRHLMPDMAIARALAKMLEHNMIRPHRGVKRNIRDVFVDVNELPLTESLDASIIHALENSEMLIVICSPNLPKSKYCMREISYFKELHGGRMDRIYTLLVDGDPAEAFPEILRRETRVVLDENGVEQTITCEVEPLFADVRASTVRQSLKKLRKTEYLRLAAAYYGCTYDDLYQRRKRWLWKMGLSAASVAAATALGFGVYAYARNLQYSAVKAATYASYARERIKAGDELLAITLCQEAWEEGVFSRSVPYMTALRSAAVQHDYKLRAEPIARMMTADYMNSAEFNFYTSSNDGVSVIVSDYISQLTDTKTGQVLHNRPVDLFRIQPSDVSWYLTISAQADDQGIFQDTLSIWSLEDQQLIRSMALRPSGLTEPDYHLEILMAEAVPDVLRITDRGETLALVDKQGNPVTQDELLQMALIAATEEPEDDPPFVMTKKKVLRNTSYTVKNRAGEALLTLEGDVQHSAFSPDYAHFACLMDGRLNVWDTATWTWQASWPIAEEDVTALLLLEDSTYLIITHGSSGVINNFALDWRTGDVLTTFTGRIIPGQEHAFYTVYGGQLTRYHYNPLDLNTMPVIVAQKDDFLLTRQDHLITLLNRATGDVLLQADSVKPAFDIYNTTAERVKASDDLTRILLRTADGLCCYDQTGKILWQTEPTQEAFILARDGSLAAWADADGAVHVVSADDGALQYIIPASDMPGVKSPNHLAVSKDGLCICDDGTQGVGQALWFPADTRQPVSLGHYSAASLYPDGTLVLTASTYVQDFALWDVKTRAFLCQPTENTGSWAYSPTSGYLVRHLETSGNHSTLELDVLRLEKDRIIPCGHILLPDVNLSALHLDSTGEVLSLTAGNTTRIYRLDKLSLLLETTDCPLYYESGALFSKDMPGGQLYTLPFLEGDALRAYALDLITSTAGTRELSLAERSRYSFDE